jgi:hypothetical protein
LRFRPGLPALAALLIAGPLGGCANLVYSEGPLFFAADARGAPRFKPGVWVGQDEGCQTDLSKPMDQWGDCAEGFVVGRKGLADPRHFKGAKLVLAAGDPMVLQMGPEPGAETNDHYYSAVKVLERDARDRVTAFSTWPVQCGPPPPPEAPDQPRGVTTAPLPGLEIVGRNCVATTREAVRVAAEASQAWTRSPAQARWLRAGRR